MPLKNRIRSWTFIRFSIILLLTLFVGCSSYRPFTTRELSWQMNAPTAKNPIFVQVADHQFLWAVVVDVVDSHFEIAREEPIRLFDNVLTEGRVDTKPKIGASLTELWHADSVGLRERFDCTLQTIRRKVVVRVIPVNGGFQIEALVHKELEDLKKPIQATASTGNMRFTNDVDSFTDQIDINPASTGWIMLGRDTAMEERLLLEIMYRLKYPSGIIRKSKDPIRA